MQGIAFLMVPNLPSGVGKVCLALCSLPYKVEIERPAENLQSATRNLRTGCDFVQLETPIHALTPANVL